MSFDSDLAGYRSYGFAHGVAGIGAFLLAAAGAAGREDFADAARRCGDTLLAASSVDAGAMYWPDCPGASRAPVWWCNGSAGIGTFLCRLHSETGDDRYLEAAIGAARAVMATRHWAGTAYCHGLPGNGDFLLDLAGATGDPTYRV
ncbi:lanthionine synthetase LanC family protein [Amycolatopsis speibonae]|uniref:Lanthionine synthetase LanC family protein n=1 Tax=Amycolatopsis speibonae TaxID=1450224 RepID=A0ABV7P917_9PSEU